MTNQMFLDTHGDPIEIRVPIQGGRKTILETIDTKKEKNVQAMQDTKAWRKRLMSRITRPDSKQYKRFAREVAAIDCILGKI